MSDAPTVTVEFVDAETGQTIGRSEMPATTLPPSFAPRTTVDFDDAAWQVEGADPVSSEEYLARRHLVLTVRRLGAINSEQIRYSLPTICDPLPPMLPNAPSGELLELHEDDWRQVELISGTQANAVMADFEAIKRIYDGHGISGPDGILRGFGSIHLRERITEPLSPALPGRQLRRLLPDIQHVYRGVGFRDTPGGVAGSFALGLGPIAMYGVTDNETVTTLALHPDDRATLGLLDSVAAGITSVMRAFDLLFVDWCHCGTVDADQVADYLRAALRA
ncbi:hypothetical protein GCM10009682_32970 [Luedemannella flava]|uniref:Uncharacterized protein n=1 Tax=Luedemannella flava TaxID=349316 RepID=A0ABP4YA13_9ACTN